jgi:RND family efflux transporter MFP subunit
MTGDPDMDKRAARDRRSGARRIALTVGACLGILGVAAGAIVLIHSTEPEAERVGATRKSAALVETLTVSRASHRPELVVLGTVEPARDIVLSPRVSGQVVAVGPNFKPGGFVRAGEVLLRIDSADFENVVAMRESALHEAQALLAIEEGRQSVAEYEFELLGEEIDASNRALVLREPQIASARAGVEAAEAAVNQAKLDRDRAEVVAPFDAQILSRSADVGSHVSPGNDLARLVGIEEYWVTATVPVRDLEWIRFPDGDRPGSAVRVRNRAGGRPGVFREGRVMQLIGMVDRQTRLARVLVTIEDPLARDLDAPPLILGTVVETRIEGRALPDIVRLDRSYLREGNTVWVLRDDQLDIREVEVVYEDARFAYIGEGLADEDQVVTTSLATVAPGIELKKMDAPAESPAP